MIFLSVTYGPDGDGRVRRNFGPINKEGGWKRLNVLTTRARRKLTVFASMHDEHIAADDISGGAFLLRQYLGYARTGRYSSPKIGNRAPESPFETAVVRALPERGHTVVSQVGEAGYRVDLVVQTARLLGYRRTGRRLRPAIEEAVERLVEDGGSGPGGEGCCWWNDRRRTMTMVEWMGDQRRERERREFAEALNELDQLPRAEHVGYGDRFGAAGVTEQAISRARRFLSLIPKHLPAPEVNPLPQGQVALQWLGERDIRLTVAIGEEPSIAYAGMFKYNKASGQEPFDGRRIPDVVLDQIERLADLGWVS